MELFLLLGIISEIAIITMIAKKERNGLQFLLYILIGYWFLSFFLRPIIFIYSRDNQIDTKIYDSRIGQSPSIFIEAMLPILIGCFVFCLPLILNSIRSIGSSKRMQGSELSGELNWLIPFGYFTGYLSLIIENSSFRNPFSKSLTTLISVTFCVFLWSSNELKLSNLKRRIFAVLGIFGIFIYSIQLNNSKGVLLMPAVIYISRLDIWKQHKKRAVKILLGIAIPSIGVPIFSIFQVRKLGEASIESAIRFNEQLPWYLSPFVALTDRFDQFARITDAISAEPNTLGSYKSWLSYLMKALQWNPNSGRKDLTFGQEWNQLVTNQSVPGSRMSTVSLAQGMIAEGLIWDGLISLVIECLLFSFLFIWIGKLLTGLPISRFLAFTLISNGSFFETGTVGFASTLSGAVKLYLFLICSKKIWFLFRK